MFGFGKKSKQKQKSHKDPNLDMNWQQADLHSVSYGSNNSQAGGSQGVDDFDPNKYKYIDKEPSIFDAAVGLFMQNPQEQIGGHSNFQSGQNNFTGSAGHSLSSHQSIGSSGSQYGQNSNYNNSSSNSNNQNYNQDLVNRGFNQGFSHSNVQHQPQPQQNLSGGQVSGFSGLLDQSKSEFEKYLNNQNNQNNQNNGLNTQPGGGFINPQSQQGISNPNQQNLSNINQTQNPVSNTPSNTSSFGGNPVAGFHPQSFSADNYHPNSSSDLQKLFRSKSADNTQSHSSNNFNPNAFQNNNSNLKTSNPSSFQAQPDLSNFSAQQNIPNNFSQQPAQNIQPPTNFSNPQNSNPSQNEFNKLQPQPRFQSQPQPQFQPQAYSAEDNNLGGVNNSNNSSFSNFPADSAQVLNQNPNQFFGQNQANYSQPSYDFNPVQNSDNFKPSPVPNINSNQALNNQNQTLEPSQAVSSLDPANNQNLDSASANSTSTQAQSSSNSQSQSSTTQTLDPEQQAQLQQAQAQAQQILSSLSDDDKEYLNFINTLVAAMTGLSLLDIAEEQRDATIEKCVQIFSDFMIDYIKTKYGDKEAMRLKSGQIFPVQNVFDRFKELGPMFDEAYQAFLQVLKDSWENDKKDDLVKQFQHNSNNNQNQTSPEMVTNQPSMLNQNNYQY